MTMTSKQLAPRTLRKYRTKTREYLITADSMVFGHECVLFATARREEDWVPSKGTRSGASMPAKAWRI